VRVEAWAGGDADEGFHIGTLSQARKSPEFLGQGF
jgi:hypothetical protein